MNMGCETIALPIKWLVTIVVVKTGFADGDHFRIRHQTGDLFCL